MKKIVIPFIMFLMIVSGCSKTHHPLMSAKKAKMVSELIIGSEKCDSFKKKLSSPTLEDDDIDDIYHEAVKAQCVFKDV